MNTNIINIGNSKGIRIPKLLLNESGLSDRVEIIAKKGEIIITSYVEPAKLSADIANLSEKSLAKEWLNKDEDEAWANL